MGTKLSIVIPVYNRGGIVGRTLASVLAQTYRPLKVILVDNASTDDTLSVLRAWQSAHAAPGFDVIVTEESTPGAAAARNAGLAYADTPWVMFFDSDDTMHPGHCRRAMEAAGADVDIVGWSVALHLPGGDRTGRFVGRATHFDNIFHGGFATLRWCARTGLVRRVGGWNPSARIWDDIELGTRMIESGARIRRLGGEPTVDVVASELSISTEPWHSRLERIDSVLDIIKSSLPPARKHYAPFRLAIAAGEALRDSSDEAVSAKAAAMRRKALSQADGMRQRLLMRFVFSYISRMPRGAAAILSVLI